MRAGARSAVAAAALSLLAHPASSQQAVAVGSVYEPGIDVTDYDIHLDLPEAGAFLRGDVTVTLRRAPGVRTLRLDLVRRMAVREVMVDGATVPADRDGDAIDVPLDRAHGDSLQVRVRYDGVVTDGLIVRHDAHGRWTWFGDNWPDRARQWLPTVDHPSDKATVRFTVRAPSSRTVVANGVLLGVSPLRGSDAGRSETRWVESHPIATYLMVIGAGDLTRTALPDNACVTSAVHRCVAQAVYTTPEDAAWMPGPFAAAPAIVSYFESLVGPFPYEKLAHLQSATRFGGMENATAIFYADRLFPERTLTDGLIAHETAHQWYGDAVTERQWAHLWLSEGFATYFAALWTRHAHGDAAFAKEMAGIRAQVLRDPVVAERPVIDTAQRNYLALLNTNSYQKGGYILYLLNQELGDSAFFAGLRAYYRDHRDGDALSDDLRRELEAASGRSLSPFFDQWLRRPGVPSARVGWAWDPATGTVSVDVSQDDRSAPWAFRMPVEVRGADETTSRTSVEVPAQLRATIALSGHFSRRPLQVLIDPQDQVLGHLTRR